MSYNGSGTFVINTAGQPVLTGTTISSTTFNALTSDLATGLTTALTKDGQSTPTADITMGAFKIISLAAGTVASDAARLDQVQGGTSTYITVTGTDTITGTVLPALAAYAAGNQFSFVVANTNTAAVTINIDGMGAKAITRTGSTALVAGDMIAGQAVEIIYDGTRFQLINGNSFTNVKVSGTLDVTGVATFTAPPIANLANCTFPTLNQDTTGTAAKANALNSATTIINVSSSPAPSAGQVLTAQSGTAATWETASTGGITSVATITTSTTLTSASAGYLQTQMTAIGQAVTLPDATTIAVGSPKFYIDNSLGGYPVGIRNTSGTLLMGIAAGGTAFVSCESISTAAGVWSITGTNLEPGLITIDNTFSSTYASTVLKPFVALDDNKSIHFLELSSGFAAVAVDKTTGAVGTPVTVSATASMVPRTVFKITSTTAMLFYSSSTGTLIGVVLSLSGATTIAVGTPSSTLTAAGVAVEDFSGAPKIAQLDSTHYLLSYATATGAGTTSVAAWEVTSGTTATLGSAVNIITSNNVENSTTTYALTATTGLVLYRSGASAPYTNSGVVISVSGTTCTVGTPAALTGVNSSYAPRIPFSCLLSSTKCLVADNNNVNGSQIVSVFTVSGTTVTAGTALSVETGTQNNPDYTVNSATRYNPHLWPISANSAGLWYLDGSSSESRVVVLSESGGTVTAGTILYRSFSGAAATASNGGQMLAQGTTEFLTIRQTGGSSNWRKLFRPHKISGTTITAGASATADILPLYVTPVQIPTVRLSSGDYVCASASMAGMPVLRTNGDSINYMGSIAVPQVNAPGGTPAAYPIQAVSANRVIFTGESVETTVSSSTTQLRLLSVEIAA